MKTTIAIVALSIFATIAIHTSDMPNSTTIADVVGGYVWGGWPS